MLISCIHRQVYFHAYALCTKQPFPCTTYSSFQNNAVPKHQSLRPPSPGLAFAFWILLLGRICLGVGVGLANQSAPVFLSEIAPAHLRGGMNIMFQLAVTIGILLAQCINLWTSTFGGWHISLLLAGAPALILLVGGIFLPDR